MKPYYSKGFVELIFTFIPLKHLAIATPIDGGKGDSLGMKSGPDYIGRINAFICRVGTRSRASWPIDSKG